MPIPPPANHLSDAVLRARLLQWTRRTNVYPLFKGTSLEKMRQWFAIVERACRASNIARTQYTEAAITLLSGDIETIMRLRWEAYLEENENGYWDWNEFKVDIAKNVELTSDTSLRTFF